MTINCLAHYTNLAYAEYLGTVEENDDYFLIKRKDRPGFFWGNYILLKGKKKNLNLEKAIQVFGSEFGSFEDTGYVAITFDIDPFPSDVATQFERGGFGVLRNKVLATGEIKKPTKIRSDLVVRSLESESDWLQYLDVHLDKEWPYGEESQQRDFLNDEISDFKKIIDLGKGKRFGAFQGTRLVGDLGVFWKDGHVRFNNVATHPEYRRQGVCTTLVYSVSSELLRDGFKKLVMEADQDYHAAKIYENLGFKHVETVTFFEKYAASGRN